MHYIKFPFFPVFACILAAGIAAAQYSREEESSTSSWDAWDEPATKTFPPPSATTAAAEPDATYIIKKGDTLWDLAFLFLGDPFLWQQIWPTVTSPIPI